MYYDPTSISAFVANGNIKTVVLTFCLIKNVYLAGHSRRERCLHDQFTAYSSCGLSQRHVAVVRNRNSEYIYDGA